MWWWFALTPCPSPEASGEGSFRTSPPAPLPTLWERGVTKRRVAARFTLRKTGDAGCPQLRIRVMSLQMNRVEVQWY